MDITRAQRAIEQLNGNFTALSDRELHTLEQDLGVVSSGLVSARAYTHSGKAREMREEVRQAFLQQLRPYVDLRTGTEHPTTDEATHWQALADQIRR